MTDKLVIAYSSVWPLARCAIIGISFPPIPWSMTLSPTTEAIRVKLCEKKPLVLGKKYRHDGKVPFKV